MNSNLFVKPLNTLHAQTFTGIEALMYQGENFLVALATGIAKIRENKKFDTASIKEGRLNEIATKFTGMNVTIAVERGFGAYVYMPPMDNSHPFQNNYLVTCPLFAASGEVVLKGKGDPIAEIDYTTAKVGGVYSMIPVSIFIGTDFFISEFTNEEIAAIILHELGHAWTYFLYLGRMYFANFLISSYANEIIGTKDVERRKILIKAAEKRLGIEIYNPNALAEQPSITKENVEILFINSHRYTLANTTGTDIYDFRSCEQLADYFATMHGAGPHLVSGLNRLYELYGSEALIPGWLYTILEIRKLMLLPLLIPAWLGILLVSNPAMKRYDDPKARAKYVELQLKGVLKNKNLAPEVKRSLLDGIEAIGKDVDRLTDHQGIEHMFWTVLSPSYRRGVKQEQSQKVIESIIFNDLYQKAAIFDSMEELNPHLDEAAIVVADSRNEWAEDLLEYNQNSLDSDIDYLNNVATNIIEDGVVTEDQIASIESICMKYGVKPTISVEEFSIKRNVVSTEALSGWAMAAIAAIIAIVLAIGWRLLNKMRENSSKNDASTNTKFSNISRSVSNAPLSQVSKEVQSNKSTVMDVIATAKKDPNIETVNDFTKAVNKEVRRESNGAATTAARDAIFAILHDPTNKSKVMDLAMSLSRKNPDFWDDLDNKNVAPMVKNENKWNKQYYNLAINDLIKNFAKERLQHIIFVRDHLDKFNNDPLSTYNLSQSSSTTDKTPSGLNITPKKQTENIHQVNEAKELVETEIKPKENKSFISRLAASAPKTEPDKNMHNYDFVELVRAHAALSTKVATKFKPTPEMKMGEYEEYMKFFFSKTVDAHVDDWLKNELTDNALSISTDLNRLSTVDELLAFSTDVLNQKREVLETANLLATMPFKDNLLKSFYKEGSGLLNNSKNGWLYYHNYFSEKLWNGVQLANCKIESNGEKYIHPRELVLNLNRTASVNRLTSNGVFNSILSGKAVTNVPTDDYTNSDDTVIQDITNVLKSIESDKEKYLENLEKVLDNTKAASDDPIVFEKKKKDIMADATKYIATVVEGVNRYMSNLIVISTYFNFINTSMSKVVAFYAATKCTYIEKK